MPVLCDFIQIVGDDARAIPPTTGNAEVRLPDFNTGGRESGTTVASTAFLIFCVANLAGSAQIFVNNVFQGTITPSPGTAFSTQLVAMTGSQLNDGNNEISLRNVTDAFTIRDVMCFFHQAS